MNRLTNEQLAEIRKRAEAAKEMPFYTWEASELIEKDVPKLLAEIERLKIYEQIFSKPFNLVAEDAKGVAVKMYGVTLKLPESDAR